MDGAADPALVAGAAVVVAVCYCCCCCSFGFPRLRCPTGLWRPPPHTPQSGVEQCRRRVRLSQRGQAPPTPLFALCHEGLFFLCLQSMNCAFNSMFFSLLRALLTLFFVFCRSTARFHSCSSTIFFFFFFLVAFAIFLVLLVSPPPTPPPPPVRCRFLVRW